MLHCLKIFLVFYLMLFTIPKVWAQNAENFPPPDSASQIYAQRTSERMTMDGTLLEASWKDAPVIEDFFRIEPRQGGNYLYKTQVRILYDDKNLYFGVFCADSLGKKGIRVQDYRRDYAFSQNDGFLIQLDPQNLKRYCMSFQTTPLGTQRDLQVFDDSFLDNDWDALWDVRTQITAEGYTAEFVIPFKSLRYEKPSRGDSLSWGITFSRLARRNYEQTVFPAIPQAFSPYRMTYAAQLKGIEVPQPSVNLRIQPYALGQYNREVREGKASGDFEAKFGGDIKWALNSHAVLDMTFFTDFAQADVDQAVNNLTRFNIFFPERRQFFLENSGIWAGTDVEGVKPFFTRSIGLDSGFNADPLDIQGGLRFVDRTQSRSMGALYVRQEAGRSTGASHFWVGRYLHNYGKQNNVGFMFTHRLDESEDSKEFSTINNSTLSIDGFFRPKDELTVQYLVSGSRDNTSDSLGTAGSIFVGYTPNHMYWGWVSKWVSPEYNSRMGFVFQNDVIQHNPGGYFIIRPKQKRWQWIRRWDPGFFVDYYQNASDGKFQQAEVYLFPIYLVLQNGGLIEWALFQNLQNINFDFRPLGIEIAQDQYVYFSQYVLFRSDASRKFSGNIRYRWGGYYNGKLNTLTTGPRYAPIPNIAATLDYEWNQFKKVGILEQNSNTHLITGGLRLAYNPRWLLSVFYQYNSFNEQGRWNIRASWQFAPLSFIYLVWNDNYLRETDLRNQSTIAKITYLKQF
ncbi:MAG: DUF5916 domain-containing protein [Microscillaceae bacterium]|nr:DUF5916 domain-containing protein [Microscillaceae bacterium]